MAWQQRIRKAAYVSPSGVRVEADYENIVKEFDKLTSAFDFPDAEGTFVQDLGRSGRRYPFVFFIWGDDYDRAAANFEDALAERGVGRLEHPLFGVIDVVPFGRIVRRDDLKTAANQAVFQVTFFETTNILFPAAGADRGRNILSKVKGYNSIASDSFKQKFNLVSAIESVGLKNRFSTGLQAVRRITQAAAAPRNEVLREFNAIYNSINKSLDLLVTSFPTSGGSDPAAREAAIENFGVLSAQTALLIQTPAQATFIDSDGELAETSGEVQLTSYNELADSFIDNPNSIQQPDTNREGANNFNVDDFFTSTSVTGAVLTTVFSQYQTKPQALEAAENVLALMDRVTAWRDANYESLENTDFSKPQQELETLSVIIDTGETYQQLQEITALTAGFLVDISFSLKQERGITLDRNRTLVDLGGELYGEVDTQLDFFILSNNLTGDEILELPKGRDVVYYV